MADGQSTKRSNLSIEIYLREINRVQLLTADGEKSLAVKVQKG